MWRPIGQNGRGSLSPLWASISGAGHSVSWKAGEYPGTGSVHSLAIPGDWSGTMSVMTVTRIERSGRTIYAALQTSSPDEADGFADDYRAALTRSTETLDAGDPESVLDRWWGIATIRANPLTENEREFVRRVRAGEDLPAGVLVEDPRL